MSQKPYNVAMNAAGSRRGKLAFTTTEIGVIAAITLIGAALRIAYQFDRSFIGDEVGTIIWMEKGVGYLLSHFTTWLTMNYFIVVEKLVAAVFGKGPFSLGAICLAAGTAAIPLTALLARRLTTAKVAVIASAFVALNPYLIMYSGFIRSYSLLMVFSILALVWFVRYQDDPGLKAGIQVSAACFLATLFHPNGVYTIGFIWIMLAVMVARKRERRYVLTIVRTMALPLAAAMMLIGLAYLAIFPEMLQDGAKWHDTPPTSLAYIPSLFKAYFADSTLRFISVLFLVAGLVSSIVKRQRLSLYAIYLVLPILLMSAQGLSHFAHAYARFLLPCLPVMLLFMAQGVVVSFEWITARRVQYAAAAAMAAILVATWIPSIKHTFEAKIPIKASAWYKASQYLAPIHQHGDVVLCEGWFMQLQLRAYLSEPDYTIAQLKDYLEAPDPGPVNQRIFLITGKAFKTDQPVRPIGHAEIVAYPPASKKAVLGMIAADYRQTAAASADAKLADTSMVNACLIATYLDGEKDPDCRARLKTIRPVGRSGLKMPSVWK